MPRQVSDKKILFHIYGSANPHTGEKSSIAELCENYRVGKNIKKANVHLNKNDGDMDYSSTDSEGENRFNEYLKFAWDPDQLKLIQMDSFTAKRRYRRITCALTDDTLKDDQVVYHNAVG